MVGRIIYRSIILSQIYRKKYILSFKKNRINRGIADIPNLEESCSFQPISLNPSTFPLLNHPNWSTEHQPSIHIMIRFLTQIVIFPKKSLDVHDRSLQLSFFFQQISLSLREVSSTPFFHQQISLFSSTFRHCFHQISLPISKSHIRYRYIINSDF